MTKKITRLDMINISLIGFEKMSKSKPSTLFNIENKNTATINEIKYFIRISLFLDT